MATNRTLGTLLLLLCLCACISTLRISFNRNRGKGSYVAFYIFLLKFENEANIKFPIIVIYDCCGLFINWLTIEMKKIRCSTTKYLFIHKLSRLAIATTTAGMCSVQYGKRYRNHTHLYMCLSKGIVTDW